MDNEYSAAMDERLLASVGLNTKEIKIYKVVLKAGEIRPALLAKAVGIKRTTCYHIAQGLAEKGLLVENSSKRPRTFSLAQPNDIEGTIEDERRRLAIREKTLKRFTSELSRATAEDSYPVPQIRFVEEQRIEQFLNSQSFKWDESMLKADGICWGFFDPTYVQEFPHVIDKYWKKTHKAIHLKMLSNSSGAHLEAKMARKYPRRSIKIWNKANFDSAIWIMGDYLLMLNTRRHPFYAVEIQDATLAHDLREVFKNLWSLV